MPKPEVRWATPADLDRFYKAHPDYKRDLTVTAMVGEVDGEIVAVGGFAHVRGFLVAFYDMDEKARPYKVSLVKAAKRMIGSVKAQRVVLAETSAVEPGAKRWVSSLGFREIAPNLYRLER